MVFSKNDQNGQDYKTCLKNNTHKIYHPLNLIGFIEKLNDNDLIVNITEDELRKRLNSVLIQLDLDSEKY